MIRALAVSVLLLSSLWSGPGRAEQPAHEVTASVHADIASAAAWQLLQDFSLAHHYVPDIVRTELVSVQPNGVGAHRRVHAAGGGYTDETIIEWDPPRGFLMRLHKGEEPLMPFALSRFRYQLTPEGEGTRLTLTLVYRMRWGLPGEKLGQWFIADKVAETVALTAAGMKHFYKTGNAATDADRQRWLAEVRMH
ncbi:SRPBCC family protein [Haliea atlantica]